MREWQRDGASWEKTGLRQIIAIGLMAGLLALDGGTALAAKQQGGNSSKPRPIMAPIQQINYSLPSGAEGNIGDLRLQIMQVAQPDLPERSACRLQVRFVNNTSQTVSVRALLRTFDPSKENLNVWLIPSGDLPPGQGSDRIYSCKIARYMDLDVGAASGWPLRCAVGGEERFPCPATMTLETNVTPIPKDDKSGKTNGTASAKAD